MNAQIMRIKAHIVSDNVDFVSEGFAFGLQVDGSVQENSDFFKNISLVSALCELVSDGNLQFSFEILHQAQHELVVSVASIRLEAQRAKTAPTLDAGNDAAGRAEAFWS